MIRRKKHNRKESRLYIPFRRLFIEELSSRIVLSSDSYSSHEDLIVSSNQKLAPRHAEFSVDGKIHGEGEIDAGDASSKIEECTLRAAMMQAIAGSSKGHSITFVNAALQDAAFIVNSTGDEEDNDTTDGVCWTGGYVSSVPVVGSHMLIQPSKALPIISSPIIIQGAVQPHLESLNTVNGSKAIQQPNETSISAFQIEPGGKGTSISNLAINGWSGNGVVINSSSTSISGNFIGVDANGTTAIPNGKNGVLIAGGTENSIGQNQWNVISGNTLNGISIEGGSENHIPQSYIGTDRWGEYDIPNGKNGVEIGPNAGKNNIGSGPLVLCSWFFGFEKQDPCTPVVSGNKLNGVFISGNSSAGSIIYSSRIGTDRDGNGKIPNLLNGVKIHETPGVEITQNVISGNTIHGISVNDSAGVKIETNRIGTNILGNGPISGSTQQEGILVHNSNNVSIIANVISGNKRNGVHLTGSGSNNATISNNNIGTDNLGDLAIANEEEGILIDGNSGGHFIGFHNLISGNKHNGIRINGGTGTRIQGNLIGTNLVNQASRPNEHNGILIEGDASNIVIGIDDSEPPEGLHDPKNIIAGNEWSGISVTKSVTEVTIAGNDIGVAPFPFVPFGNGHSGIELMGSNNHIGTENNLGGNFIAYNVTGGVVITGDNNTVFRNHITTNNEDGVDVRRGSRNEIGGVGKGNTITDNQSTGVSIGIDSNGTKVVGNVVSRNNWYGIRVRGNDNQIGAPGKISHGNDDHKNRAFGNIITENASSGVDVDNGLGNSIRLNSIYQNGKLGIDLRNGQNSYSNSDGVTINDEDFDDVTMVSKFDFDDGPNNLQNFPIVHKYAMGNANDANGTPLSAVRITLNSKPDTKYLIDLYYVPIRDESNFGEGRDVIVAGHELTTGKTGSITTDIMVSSSLISRDGDTYHLTATATDPDGNTSEFSGRELKIFYGIDGTGSAAWLGEGPIYSRPKLNQSRWNSHTKNLYEELVDKIEYAYYDRGPNKFTTGSDSPELHNNALIAIEKATKLIHAQNSKVTARVALAGWSRGAQVALWVARDLATKYPFKNDPKFEIDFVGLYDPVDMSIQIENESSIVESRIDRVYAVGPIYSKFRRVGSFNLDGYEELGTILGEYDPIGNPDWRFFVRQSHHPLSVMDIGGSITEDWNSGIRKASGNQRTVLDIELLDASHGSIGGTPGFNQSSNIHIWGELANDGKHVVNGVIPPTKYVYGTDVENAIKSDKKIRSGFRAEGWPLRNIPNGMYGFPPDNPPDAMNPPPGGEGEGIGIMAPGIVLANEKPNTVAFEMTTIRDTIRSEFLQNMQQGPRITKTVYTVELRSNDEEEVYGPEELSTKELSSDILAIDWQFSAIDELLSSNQQLSEKEVD